MRLSDGDYRDMIEQLQNRNLVVQAEEGISSGDASHILGCVSRANQDSPD